MVTSSGVTGSMDRANENCTGPRTDYSKYQHPLFVNLLARGLIDHDPLALGIVAVQEHDVERAVSEVKTLADVLFVANKLSNLESGWRDPEFGAAPDTSALAGLFDDAAIAALLAESEEELSALRSALGG